LGGGVYLQVTIILCSMKCIQFNKIIGWSNIHAKKWLIKEWIAEWLSLQQANESLNIISSITTILIYEWIKLKGWLQYVCKPLLIKAFQTNKLWRVPCYCSISSFYLVRIFQVTVYFDCMQLESRVCAETCGNN
jgi:hypothetical protein